LAKSTDFQFAMNKSNKSERNSLTQQRFQMVSPNSTEKATFNGFSSVKMIQLLHGKHV